MRITHVSPRWSEIPSDKFYDIGTQQRRSVSPCKLSVQNFENFTIRDRFSRKKRKNAQNCQVLRLQAVISPQWLQIAGNSRPYWPSTGCLVLIFTVWINSKSRLCDVRSVQAAPPPKFFATFITRSLSYRTS